MANLTGKTLGNYKIIERIGRGGMAEVYKGYHSRLDRHVAIKILHGFLAEGEDFLARFEREAKAVASLRHQNIVQIHDFEKEDDFCYMVMEYVDSGTLTARLKESSREKTTIPLPIIKSIIRQISKALDYAHKQGLIHRDIKPSNILIDNQGHTYLTDFGIARMMSSTHLTATGALIGTPAYMSPEQCKGLDLTSVSDIYSLGIILYEMLTGIVPYDSETPLSVLQKHVTEPMPPLHQSRPDLPATFEEVLKNALAKEPADRYQTAFELYEAFVQAADSAEATSEDSTTKPTLMMEEEIMDSTSKPTEVMSESEEEEPALPQKKVVKEESINGPEGEHTKKPAISKPKEMEEDAEGALKKSSKPGFDIKTLIKNKYVIIAGAVILAVVLFFVFSGGIGGCSSVDECLVLAEEAQRQGDIESAVTYLEKAIARVPDNEHPQYAGLWCQRGDFLNQLDRINEATESFEFCNAWERGE